MVGFGLVLTAIILFSCLIAIRLRGGQDNPYIGIAVMAIGGVLVLGAVLAPLGIWLGRRRLSQRISGAAGDGGVAWRRFFVFLAVTSIFNVLIASRATEEAVHTMESRQFCGSCHVMTPESRAFGQGPHAGR